jgi:hypothetical protein
MSYGDETKDVCFNLYFTIHLAVIESLNATHIVHYEVHDIGDGTRCCYCRDGR